MNFLTAIVVSCFPNRPARRKTPRRGHRPQYLARSRWDPAAPPTTSRNDGLARAGTCAPKALVRRWARQERGMGASHPTTLLLHREWVTTLLCPCPSCLRTVVRIRPGPRCLRETPLVARPRLKHRSKTGLPHPSVRRLWSRQAGARQRCGKNVLRHFR